MHSFQLLIYDCDYPKWSLVFILPNAIFFYFLFSEFYNKAYTPEQQAAHDAAKKKKDDDAAAQLTNGKANGHTAPNGKIHQNGNGPLTNGKSIVNGKTKTA